MPRGQPLRRCSGLRAVHQRGAKGLDKERLALEGASRRPPPVLRAGPGRPREQHGAGRAGEPPEAPREHQVPPAGRRLPASAPHPRDRAANRQRAAAPALASSLSLSLSLLRPPPPGWEREPPPRSMGGPDFCSASGSDLFWVSGGRSSGPARPGAVSRPGRGGRGALPSLGPPRAAPIPALCSSAFRSQPRAPRPCCCSALLPSPSGLLLRFPLPALPCPSPLALLCHTRRPLVTPVPPRHACSSVFAGLVGFFRCPVQTGTGCSRCVEPAGRRTPPCP